ncbi:hypothetical protein BH09MYX1_BH09MYX1_55020 [soil metagenome]
MLRRRFFQALVAATAASFLSGAPPGPARAKHAPLAANQAAFGAERPDVHRNESFDFIAANNNEKITVRFVDGVVTPQSAKEARHLMRCLKNDQEHDIDPRLLYTLWQLSREGSGTLLLISAYRAPERRGDTNYHTRGQAADVRIPGSWSWRMRDAAKRIGVRGLGTYPTTNMIHVDVRDDPFTWVDYSGPSH